MLTQIYQFALYILGYVPKDKSVTTCQAENNWMPDVGNLTCLEAVALIIGGKLKGGLIGESRAEVYGLNTSMVLPNFVSGSWGQAVFYLEGEVIMCGGCSETIAKFCLKGEYQKKKKGSSGISVVLFIHDNLLTWLFLIVLNHVLK